MAISTYAELTTAINDWAEQSYASSVTDSFIALAEAAIRDNLGTHFKRLTVSTVAVNSSGIGTLPTGFTQAANVVRDVVGCRPLKQLSYEALVDMNRYELAGEPSHYAVLGTQIYVAPVAADNYLVTHYAEVTALSGSATTNWLLTTAPHAYLFMCLAYQRVYEEDFETAAAYEAKAVDILGKLKARADLAAFGNIEIKLEQVA